MKKLYFLMAALAWLPLLAQTAPPKGSSRHAINTLMATHKPALEYTKDLPADSLAAWRQKMSGAMATLMRHPGAPAREEELVARVARPGYTVERWRSWPLNEGPVNYLVLIPDTTAFPGPRPAALCIPGFGQTKEMLAGERAATIPSRVKPPKIPGATPWASAM